MSISTEEYFTLFLYDEEAGLWFDEFGSYDREEVKEEEDIASDVYYWHTIVETDGTHEALMKASEKLNYLI